MQSQSELDYCCVSLAVCPFLPILQDGPLSVRSSRCCLFPIILTSPRSKISQVVRSTINPVHYYASKFKIPPVHKHILFFFLSTLHLAGSSLLTIYTLASSRTPFISKSPIRATGVGGNIAYVTAEQGAGFSVRPSSPHRPPPANRAALSHDRVPSRRNKQIYNGRLDSRT